MAGAQTLVWQSGVQTLVWQEDRKEIRFFQKIGFLSRIPNFSLAGLRLAGAQTLIIRSSRWPTNLGLLT